MVSVLMPNILSHGFPLGKTLREVLKPLQHKFLLCVWRLLRPTGALLVKRCFPILTCIEHLFC